MSGIIIYPKDANGNLVLPEMHPFASPEYRTKIDGTASIATCVINSTEYIDYQLTEERYVSGGTIVIKNAEFGDWVCAAVYDKDSVIPEEYRELLCEDHPIVAQYIIKSWIRPDGNTSIHQIDTRPLNAKISAGLYLRIGYHACNSGSSREIVMNYDLTKKL